ncbi:MULTISPECIES: hypothetical protein [unclassified Flavobacterium]|uniref:hypothetical protein n=1 Tax=unclassified Flavobacterium TaxID=196869 RepID=UPI003F930533
MNNRNQQQANGLNKLNNAVGKSFASQKRHYFNYLKKHVATNSMVTAKTGIPQKNLTRFKRQFQKKGLLFEVFTGICQKTKFRATYLTTSLELFKKYKV